MYCSRCGGDRALSDAKYNGFKVVYAGCLQKSHVRVFCEETWRFSCQSGPRVVAQMARPVRLPTVVGLAVVVIMVLLLVVMIMVVLATVWMGGWP